MRRRLLRWANGFALVNAAILAVIALRYVWQYSPTLSPGVAWAYAVVAYVSHIALLAYVPLLLLLPLTLILPRPRLIRPLAVLLASALAAFLALDSLVFAEQRYHLNVLTFRILEPTTWAFLALYLLLALIIEAMLSSWVWKRTETAFRMGWVLPVVLGICLLSSQFVHAWAAPYYYVPVTAFDRYLPLYVPMIKSTILGTLRLVDRKRARAGAFISSQAQSPDRTLNYPIDALRCDTRVPPLNVLLVVIDGMRADALNADTAPELSKFAPSAIRFDGHYSGGNSSQPGMFSLFYGIPPTYFDAFFALARPPLLMDLFRQRGYQLGLFSSSPVYRAVVGLDRTAFANVPNLRLETPSVSIGSGETGSAGRDRALTAEWYEWLQRRDPARPFFGFLYYNAAIALDVPEGYPPIVTAPPGAPLQQRRKARYLTAVHFVDSVVGKVLDDLARRRLADSTVVIVTSDHGIEFDEAGLGFTGHGSAYSNEQIRTPLLLRWPGHAPGRVLRRTSHYDLAPTLLTELFGCTNPPSDYASGHSLFSDAEWDWLVVASRTDYAVVQPERVTVIFSSGFEIRDRSYRLIASPAVSSNDIRAAFREMNRFYR